jgi:hypothetical protein
MNNQFDELAKGLAQSVTRRGALKKLGTGVASIPLAWLGTATARTGSCKPSGSKCSHGSQCCSGLCDYAFIGRPGVCA